MKGATTVKATSLTSPIEWINSINAYSIVGGRELNRCGRYLRRLGTRGQSSFLFSFFFTLLLYFLIKLLDGEKFFFFSSLSRPITNLPIRVCCRGFQQVKNFWYRVSSASTTVPKVKKKKFKSKKSFLFFHSSLSFFFCFFENRDHSLGRSNTTRYQIISVPSRIGFTQHERRVYFESERGNETGDGGR